MTVAEDLRTYDPRLLGAIREREHVEEPDGLPTLFKPVPDDEREHVLDQRVRAVAERKRAMFAERARETAGTYSLANERFRPDKVTYDLTTERVACSEQLVDVNGSHKVDVFAYRAESAVGLAPICVFLHGGGFTAGNERIYHNQMKFVAERSGALVVFPEYRLAPENPFPAAIEDSVATVRWAREHAAELGADPSRIMVAGDSAGGSLATACALEDDACAISRIFLLFPGSDMSDYRGQTRYLWSYDHYPIVSEHRDLAYSRIDRIRSGCTASAEESLYVQGRTSLEDPLVSVVCASDEQLGRFPPTTVAYSEYDFLRMGNEYFAKRLHDLGGDVRVIRYCGCDHGFLDLFGSEPQAEDVCLELSADIGRM